VLDFYGTNKNDSKPVFVANNDMTENQLIQSQEILESGHIFTKGLSERVSKSTDSITLFRDNLDTDNYKFKKITNKEFFELPEAKKNKLAFHNFKAMTQIDSTTPRSIRNKLCDMVYSGVTEYFKRSDCKENFEEFIHIQGAQHVVDTVKLDEYQIENNVSKAQMIPGSEENQGGLNRGYAFMAAKGYRASEAWGKSDSLTESISASLYYDGPPSVFLLTAGVTKSHSTFTENVNAKMHMMFTRTFTTLTPVKLDYNSITVNFKAHVKRCFVMTDIKKKVHNYHVCSDKPHRKSISEKWYFIGESDAQKHGVLTDGVEVGEKANLKVIRGERNFKKIWSMFESEDTKTVIAEMKDFNLGEKFLEYKKNNTLNIGMETSKSSSFPGLLR
jgi:hypothetical protein